MPVVLIRKIRRNLQNYGWGKFLRKSLAVGLKPLFLARTYYFYIIDLNKFEPKVPRFSGEFVFRFITPDEKDLIDQIEAMEEWLLGKLADKLRAGQKCLAILNGNKVAGFNLISFQAFCLDVVEYNKPLRPSECASEQITIHPHYRRRGLATDLRNLFFLEMKKAGLQKIYGGTEVLNTANLALTRKVGFTIIAKARFVKILTYRRFRLLRFRK